MVLRLPFACGPKAKSKSKTSLKRESNMSSKCSQAIDKRKKNNPTSDKKSPFFRTRRPTATFLCCYNFFFTPAANTVVLLRSYEVSRISCVRSTEFILATSLQANQFKFLLSFLPASLPAFFPLLPSSLPSLTRTQQEG